MDPVKAGGEVGEGAHEGGAIREDAEQELLELQYQEQEADGDSLREALHTVIEETKFDEDECRLTTKRRVQQNEEIGEGNGCYDKEYGE